ncbi:hypothetical protein [Antarcticimicrobium sediminis]|uniref:Uncharacterized protein n=1 Tax=Antarcticimicrobium sediminis TaxID=2546227 RepID=A0A4R5F183_9RHOB|nr:hypothetical protein [Antarcticimicrobium sediminis]TDE41129.1 hypothetical protein E1B25_02670 [Antarcticimicrobium sediminis]
MTHAEIENRIAEIAELMRAKLGGRGTTLRAVLRKARPQLPRRIRSRAKLLAEAEPFAQHPQLRLTLDAGALERAASEVEAHLKAIDLADRRKGWWLGMLGGLAFNVLLLTAVLIALLRWRGFV